MPLIEEVSNMTHGEDIVDSGTIWLLPDDVLYIILSFCDLQSLGRLALVCRRLARLVQQECVWIGMGKRLTIVTDPRNASQNR